MDIIQSCVASGLMEMTKQSGGDERSPLQGWALMDG